MATTIVEEVKDFIENSLLIKRNVYYRKEKAVEKEMVKQMRAHFGSENVDSQHTVGGFLNLKCDIDIHDGQCGVELKLAKELDNATKLQRVLGQVFYYSQRQYKDTGLILLVVGTAASLNPKLKELKAFVEQIPGIHFMYKQAGDVLNKEPEPEKEPTKRTAPTPHVSDTHLFFCTQGDCNASGALVNDGFLVLAGSVLRAVARDSAKPSFIQKRKQFIAELCDIVNGKPVLKKDYTFTSPSAAAAMMVGGNADGWTVWQNADGKTLSKIYRKR